MGIRRFAAIAASCILLGSNIAHSFDLNTSAVTPTNATGLWWNPNESGWGITLTQQSTVIFATMFSYDSFGMPTWYVASNCSIAGAGCTGDLYRVTGGRSPITSWSGASVSVVKVGTLSIALSDINNGTVSYTIDGSGGFKNISRQIFGQAAPPGNDNRARTELLIGGTWTITYTIITSFTDRFTFTSVRESTSSPGEYNAFGTNSFGQSVIGGYNSGSGNWAILDPGTIIDQFYVFSFSGNNFVSGCYYQINPPGSTNLSRCYSMTGTRSPPKAFEESGVDPSVKMQEVMADEAPIEVDPQTLEAYKAFRKQLPH